MTLDLRNEIFGNLTVKEKADRIYQSRVWRTQWLCICLCGNETLKTTVALRTSKTMSCGNCQWHIKHAWAYNSWQSARQRVFNPNNKDYSSYGGRGIIMCERWNEFANFYRDMGDPPIDTWTKERLSLDRIDVNGNYEPGNCKWSDRSEQQFNKR